MKNIMVFIVLLSISVDMHCVVFRQIPRYVKAFSGMKRFSSCSENIELGIARVKSEMLNYHMWRNMYLIGKEGEFGIASLKELAPDAFERLQVMALEAGVCVEELLAAGEFHMLKELQRKYGVRMVEEYYKILRLRQKYMSSLALDWCDIAYEGKRPYPLGRMVVDSDQIDRLGGELHNLAERMLKHLHASAEEE